MSRVKLLGLDMDDKILKNFMDAEPNAIYISKDKIHQFDKNIPICFRSMTKRKIIAQCREQGRDFYYVDNGYIGNLEKKKKWYRIVKNDVQHSKKIVDVPGDRFAKVVSERRYMAYAGKKLKGQDGPILLVTPSEKPCNYYNIKRDEWVQQTLNEISKYTDRKVIIRDKGLRPDRIGGNSIAAQCARDNIFALVTYQSMAALEAIHYGIPAFTLAPTCTQHLANKDLKDIENPKYPKETDVYALLKYLSYCQYTTSEMASGEAMRLIEGYNL